MGGAGPHGIESYRPPRNPDESHTFRADDGRIHFSGSLARGLSISAVAKEGWSNVVDGRLPGGVRGQRGGRRQGRSVTAVGMGPTPAAAKPTKTIFKHENQCIK